jgi:cytoskeleton protein RodZ
MNQVNVTELSEDIEVIGPGQMLSDAREQMNLSVEDVAVKLNFRICQVKDIEADIFDKATPETFTRGYLLNYAKLVGIPSVDIIASYESLGVAEKQGAEMQSFSKITEKEAQHSRIMWLSYLIIIALVTLSVVYYFQEAKSQQKNMSSVNTEQSAEIIQEQQREPLTTNNADAEKLSIDIVEVTMPKQDEMLHPSNISAPKDTSDNATRPVGEAAEQLQNFTTVESLEQSTMAQAIFTFAGDCWVNIHDSTGERIAYGIKKAGYVMELNAKAPFEVTVGKPELVSIILNGKTIDMSKYNSGNIAKFTLPETPES